MDPFVLTGWLLVAVIIVMCFAYFRPRRRITSASLTVEQANINWPQERARLEERERERDRAGLPRAYRETNIGKNAVMSFGDVPKDERVTFGKRKVEPYTFDRHDATHRKPTITLTPRQIERINTQRKLRGKPPFNRTGLTNAVAHPWDRYDVRQPQNTNDWLSYLIMYEILSDDHRGHTVAGCGGVTIDPNLPYNGQGGEFAGAGASGDWSDNVVRAQAAAVEHGVPFASDLDPKYSPGDTVSGYTAPDPAPSAPSAPVSDSSPVYNSSAPVSDSGGGGGGGGGGD